MQYHFHACLIPRAAQSTVLTGTLTTLVWKASPTPLGMGSSLDFRRGSAELLWQSPQFPQIYQLFRRVCPSPREQLQVARDGVRESEPIMPSIANSPTR